MHVNDSFSQGIHASSGSLGCKDVYITDTADALAFAETLYPYRVF